MAYEHITLETDGAVGVLTLNRPARLNVMNAAMLDEMMAACDLVEADDAIRALVLTGAGKAFSAGFDLAAQAAAPPEGHAAWEPVLRKDFDAVMRFWHLSKPTIAAVRGPALADRVISVDGLVSTIVIAVTIASVRPGSGVVESTVLVVALGGFVGTAILARFIERRGS